MDKIMVQTPGSLPVQTVHNIIMMMCIVYVFYTVDANGLGDPVRRSHVTKSIVHEGNDEFELHVVISKNSRATDV